MSIKYRVMNVFLIGFMGAGKSAAARCMQERYGCRTVEMDEEIEVREGRPIPQIFAESGEAYFRDLETALLREIAGKKDGFLVVSCGGGAVLREENVRLMKSCGRIVLLTAAPETVLARVSRTNDRPLLVGKSAEEVRALMERRRPAYDAAADAVIATDVRSPDEICREILRCAEAAGD